MNDELFKIFREKQSDMYDEFRSAKYKISITSICPINIIRHIVLLLLIESLMISTLVHDL
jgi:hypothetical protein